jgi:flavin-dependent dehydrogenase
MEYDVVIGGASFSGLSVASEISGDVLLIDRKEIGSGQTSACGTFLKTLKNIGCEKSVLQKFSKACVHCPDEIEIDLIETMCTFDYSLFCKTLERKIKPEFLLSAIKGVKGNSVVTDKGCFKSKCIVDCTGWPAVMASSLRKDFVDRSKLSFGLETIVDYKDNRLHFFLDPKIIRHGVAWVFPIGGKSRMGVASYVGDTDLIPDLKRFVKRFDSDIGEVYGGFIPYGMREPVVGDVFLAGDAAGHVPPLTAEGIRKAIHFGKACGKEIQKVIDGNVTLGQALENYRRFAMREKKGYDMLLKLQNMLVSGGIKGGFLARVMRNKFLCNSLQKRYLRF